MNARGIGFLQEWIRENVRDEDRKGSAIRAMSLADYCIEDAQSVGISASDMEPEWGSIETLIYDAMQSDVDAVLELWKVVAVAHDKKPRGGRNYGN